ncbi:hypothetical protein KBY76_05830 [Synechococcus sp. GreenBA-s]|nr:hypothetical protein [Synechococcus sp. GreenBA-s]
MSAPVSATLQHRISEQLQALSQVGESLTLRLLDLEERLKLIEEHLSDQASRSEADTGLELTGEILALTEERIARLEDLLTGQRPEHAGAGHPHLHLSSVPAYAKSSSTAVEEPELDPFPEDEEQPFMDELSA